MAMSEWKIWGGKPETAKSMKMVFMVYVSIVHMDVYICVYISIQKYIDKTEFQAILIWAKSFFFVSKLLKIYLFVIYGIDKVTAQQRVSFHCIGISTAWAKYMFKNVIPCSTKTTKIASRKDYFLYLCTRFYIVTWYDASYLRYPRTHIFSTSFGNGSIVMLVFQRSYGGMDNLASKRN